MLNNKKGITLIALVVTVVVLIILAGVSINAVLGDNGIIKKANQAASVTKEAEVKEAINRTILEFYLTEDYETLEDFLKAKAEDGSIDSVTKNADGTLTVKKGNYSVTVENKTNSSGGGGSGGSTGGETQTPEITVGEIKVVADSTGTGSAITDANSVYLGNTLYITFSHSITGGTTMLEFSKGIKTDKKFENVTIVPARGSVGLDIEIQSNNIASDMSKRLHSKYELLNLPDKLGKESMMMLAQEPEIKRTLDLVSNSNIVVFGVGRADEMILKRNLPESKTQEILDKGAIGESFGYYFNQSGEIVYRLNTIGIDLESVKQARNVIAVFAGSKKVEAFLAISKINENLVLVTDEHSGRKLIDLLKHQDEIKNQEQDNEK